MAGAGDEVSVPLMEPLPWNMGVSEANAPPL